MSPRGFSTAMRRLGAPYIRMKNSAAASCRPSALFCAQNRAPASDRSVHGGNEMMRSHGPKSNALRMSAWMCCPGVSDGSRSHDQASHPRAAKASRTRPDDSHAASIRSVTVSPSARLHGTSGTAIPRAGRRPRHGTSGSTSHPLEEVQVVVQLLQALVQKLALGVGHARFDPVKLVVLGDARVPDGGVAALLGVPEVARADHAGVLQ